MDTQGYKPIQLESQTDSLRIGFLPCGGVSTPTGNRFTSCLYKGESVGEYFADILVEDTVIVELKCVDRLASEHMAQCLNYLRASGKKLCLLINFQKPTVEWKRVAL